MQEQEGKERKKKQREREEREETTWKNRPVRTIQQACIGALSVTLPPLKTNPILCRILQQPSDFCSILYSSLLKLFLPHKSIFYTYIICLRASNPTSTDILKLLQVVILPKTEKKENLKQQFHYCTQTDRQTDTSLQNRQRDSGRQKTRGRFLKMSY